MLINVAQSTSSSMFHFFGISKTYSAALTDVLLLVALVKLCLNIIVIYKISFCPFCKCEVVNLVHLIRKVVVHDENTSLFQFTVKSIG